LYFVKLLYHIHLNETSSGFEAPKLRQTNMTKLILAVLVSAVFLLASMWFLLPHPSWSNHPGPSFMGLASLAGLLTLGFMLGFKGERHRMHDFILTDLLCKWLKTKRGKGS
jgi:hypothetical protein